MNLFQAASQEALRMYVDLQDIHLDWSKLGDFSTQPNEFLKILKNNTKIVSVREFLEKFSKSVEDFERNVLTNSPGWFAVINHDMIQEQDYDETWMPKQRILKYDAKDKSQCAMKSGLFFFLLAVRLRPSILNKLKGILCLPTQFQIPVELSEFDYCAMDDMSYTGLQVVNTMQSISSGKKHLVCAFIGQGASTMLHESKINVFTQQIIPTFETYEPSRKMTKDYKYDAYPIVFSHKIADNISSFPEVYERIAMSRVMPPYKTQGKFSYYTYLINDVVKSYVTTS